MRKYDYFHFTNREAEVKRDKVNVNADSQWQNQDLHLCLKFFFLNHVTILPINGIVNVI